VDSALVVLAALGGAVFARLAPSSRAESTVTWDCGYASPTARMQYTASSFADGIVRLFAWALRPFSHADEPTVLFPAAARFRSHVPDTVLDRVVLPLARRAARVLVWFRWIQQGNVHLYVLYIVVALVVTVLFRR
jgi:hypothetical protein